MGLLSWQILRRKIITRCKYCEEKYRGRQKINKGSTGSHLEAESAGFF